MTRSVSKIRRWTHKERRRVILEMEATLIIKQTKPGRPATNGMPHSPAQYGIFDGDKMLAEIRKWGSTWGIQDAVTRSYVGPTWTLKEAKQLAREIYGSSCNSR